MNESDFKSQVTKRIRDHEGGYARRFEDQFAVGIPDVVVIPVGGPTFFIEAKIVKSGNAWAPRPRQLVELNRIKDTEHAIPVMMCLRLSDDTVHIDIPAEKLSLPGKVSFPRLGANYTAKLSEYYLIYKAALNI